MGLLASWFSSDGFMPHGHCYRWASGLLWTYVVSDTAVGLAYYTVSGVLILFAHKRRDLSFNWIFLLFAAFVFACGTTHFVAVWAIWQPHYWLDSALKAATALAALATAILIWPLMPKALLIPRNAQWQEAIRQPEREANERKNAELALRESQVMLRELAAYQERIREDERKHIAREIHDELGQNLLALRLDVSALHAFAGGRHPRLHKRTGMALEYLDTTMKSVRSIMNNLRPPVLDLGLTAAIDWQVRQFEQRNGIACELVLDDDGIEIDDPRATAIFRILQESLTNVGRHARATHVRIELRVDAERLVLTIKDNGIGMYPGDRRKMHRFGLIGIEERVSMLGGSLRINSVPGQGTVIHLTVPLRNAGIINPAAPAA